MVCPKCGATVADNLLECSGCGEDISLTVWMADGQQYGPYTVAAARQYVTEGRIDPSVSQARVGDGQWGPLHDALASVGVQVPAPPPPVRPAGGTSAGGSGSEWLARQVPYRNAPALTAYYLGVFSLIPFLGIPLGLIAIPLGVMGLRRAREHPEAHGAQHAWTGIVAGALSVIGHGVLVAWMATS